MRGIASWASSCSICCLRSSMALSTAGRTASKTSATPYPWIAEHGAARRDLRAGVDGVGDGGSPTRVSDDSHLVRADAVASTVSASPSPLRRNAARPRRSAPAWTSTQRGRGTLLGHKPRRKISDHLRLRSGDSHLFTAKTVSICDGHFCCLISTPSGRCPSFHPRPQQPRTTPSTPTTPARGSPQGTGPILHHQIIDPRVDHIKNAPAPLRSLINSVARDTDLVDGDGAAAARVAQAIHECRLAHVGSSNNGDGRPRLPRDALEHLRGVGLCLSVSCEARTRGTTRDGPLCLLMGA